MRTTAKRKNRIRIVRTESRPYGRAAFQREWEPVFCPETGRKEQGAQRAKDGHTRAIRKTWLVPRHHYSAIEAFALTLTLTAVVSLSLAIRNAGLTLDATLFWLSAWPLSALVAVPARFLIAPLVTKAVALIVTPDARP